MLYLSKEATSKDQQFITQIMLSFQDDESKCSEKIWQESDFFGYQRAELTIAKANFPENILCCIYQGAVALVKGGEKALYLDFIVLDQLMLVENIVKCTKNQQDSTVVLPKN